MRYLISIILIAVSAGMFFLFIDPLYQETKLLKQQISALNETFSNSQKIQEVRDSLFAKFNTIPEEELTRLEKILPDNVDNVKLILELDRIASQNGMDLRGVDVRESSAGDGNGLGPSGREYGSLDIGLTLTGSYRSFRGFLAALERSLRLVDVTALSFRATGFDFDQYALTIRTYWLK